ncbi:DUF6544 family protein [Neolewinella aquimaris]|uniref:DUF6544 family protein n=1 Tax=Neolewinella aquimaris TaxID=1835722 RepID=UPI0038731BD2
MQVYELGFAQLYYESRLTAKRICWVIDVESTAMLDGVRIPSRAAVTWQLPDGPWTWVEVTILNKRGTNCPQPSGNIPCVQSS